MNRLPNQKVTKLKLKFPAVPGLALSGFEQPGPVFFVSCLEITESLSTSRVLGKSFQQFLAAPTFAILNDKKKHCDNFVPISWNI